MITRRTVSLFALGVVTLASATSFAQPSNPSRSPWTAAIEVGPLWHHDPSFDAFRTGHRAPPIGGLVFGRDLLHLGPRLTLGAEVGWAMEISRGRVRQAFDTQLVTNHLQAAVTLRFELKSWLTPYARFSGGAAYLDASVTSDDGVTLGASAWTPFGSAGAGVMLTSGAWFEGAGARTLRLMLAVEGGYQLVMSSTLRASAPTPSDERSANDRIASQAVALGTLDPSAAYLRVVTGFRF